MTLLFGRWFGCTLGTSVRHLLQLLDMELHKVQKFAMAQFGAVVVRLREPCCVADVFDDFVEGGSLLGSPEGDGFFAQLHIVHLEIVVGLVLIQVIRHCSTETIGQVGGRHGTQQRSDWFHKADREECLWAGHCQRSRSAKLLEIYLCVSLVRLTLLMGLDHTIVPD